MALAYDDDDEGGDDLLFFAVVVAAGYFLLQRWRYNAAAASGGGVFESIPPVADFTFDALNFLVPLRLSPTGADFIKANEGGFRANAYPDAGGQSIGYGHFIQPGENIVSPITPAEGEALFAHDVAGAERAVSDGLKVQVSQSQFDALVDLAYNIGTAAFLSSTLLRLLNGGDFNGAAQQFSQWIHSGGQVSSNLVARRQSDTNLFERG